MGGVLFFVILSKGMGLLCNIMVSKKGYRSIVIILNEMRFLYTHTHIGYGYKKIGDKGETILFVIMITSSLMFMYASLDIYFSLLPRKLTICGYQCFVTNLFLGKNNYLTLHFTQIALDANLFQGVVFFLLFCFKEKQLSQKKNNNHKLL